MSQSETPNKFGPNQEALFKRVTEHITHELSDKERFDRTGKRIVAALVGDVDQLAAIPNESVTQEEVMRHELFTGCLALFSMADSVRSSEYYFRRYRFVGLPVTRADHLMNSCEMYFDRLAQFRDRMKTTLTAAQRLYPGHDFQVGKIVKIYDRLFNWEIRQRNRVHHKGRYEDQYIDQLGLIQTLEIGMPMIREMFSSRGIHRKAVNLWVKRVRHGADALDQFLERLSGLILAGLPAVDGQSTDQTSE